MNRIAFALTAVLVTAAVPGAVAQQQTLKSWALANGAPFNMREGDPDTGVATEIMDAVAKEAGFKVEYVYDTNAHSLIGLLSRQYDLVPLRENLKRAEIAEFSDPIWVYGESLVVPKDDDRDYKNLNDLKGMVIGALDGSPVAASIASSGIPAEVRMFPSAEALFAAVNRGEVKAGTTSEPIATWQMAKADAYPNLRIAPNFRLSRDPFAIGVRRTDAALLNRINPAIAKLKANGTFKAIFAKYGIAWMPPKD